MSFSFAQLLATLRVADLIDVALVAAFLYGLFSWLRRSTSQAASRRLAAVVVILGALYLLASLFELFLVESLLRGLLLVSLVAAVVVFQAEIRRLLAQLGSFNPFASSTNPGETTIDQLVEASAHLAAAKTGALIALKGQEPWDDLIQGGVTLDALVSEPLLYSLFNPETAGHDGAVLMEGQRLIRFAAHLPLATDLPDESRFGGTRHAAALGLSENCDALVIVVSEERGVMSVAQGSELTELGSASELKERVEAFWQHRTSAEHSKWQRWRPRLQTASLSLGSALLLWLFFAYSPDTVSRTLSVPVEFRNLPEDWVLTNLAPETVQATLIGSERSFALMDREVLAVSFDLTAPREGSQSFAVGEDRLELPTGLRLNSVSPQQVRVEAHQLVRAEVPVEVPTVGSLPESLGVADIRTNPDTVTLLVPMREAESPQRVLTEPLDLREVRRDLSVRRLLVLPPGWYLPEDQGSEVEVSVRIQE